MKNNIYDVINIAAILRKGRAILVFVCALHEQMLLIMILNLMIHLWHFSIEMRIYEHPLSFRSFKVEKTIKYCNIQS